MHTTGCLGVSPETCSFFVFSPPDKRWFFFSSSRTVSFVLDRCSATRFTCIIYWFVYSPDMPPSGGSREYCYFFWYRNPSRKDLYKPCKDVILWGMFHLHQGPPHCGVSGWRYRLAVWLAVWVTCVDGGVDCQAFAQNLLGHTWILDKWIKLGLGRLETCHRWGYLTIW